MSSNKTDKTLPSQTRQIQLEDMETNSEITDRVTKKDHKQTD